MIGAKRLRHSPCEARRISIVVDKDAIRKVKVSPRIGDQCSIGGNALNADIQCKIDSDNAAAIYGSNSYSCKSPIAFAGWTDSSTAPQQEN